ncbi:aromatic ring-hydroxylating oxygenase subunit alpha [Rugosibacter aromaticivorans]|uniref:aromatic ring-hydroxylating oxygenase subunit alpha n=1 Tax=Rugosibacter aromaticivorans TaxID=1565605 RepID=UPI000A97CD0E|nr:aromatic ring-hydroxylating dioxygenase subunit alpha [Rugosibacter aromaticivorans]
MSTHSTHVYTGTYTGDAPRVWPAKVNQIPKEVFGDEALFEEELKKIFYGDTWHAVGHAAEIPNVGDFKTFDLGRVPLLIARGKDNQVRVFFNSCTHRGNQLETSVSGNRKEFECPYHRWLFSLDGTLAACPGSKEFAPDFKQEHFGLVEVKTDQYLGLILVTMGKNTPPLKEWLGESALPTLNALLGGDGRLKLLGYQKVRYASNWKGYNDNDGYHAPLLHTGFRLLNWQGGKGFQRMTPNGHVLFEAELKPATGNGFLKDPSLIEFKGSNPERGSVITQLFPMTVMTKHMDVINLRFAIARSHEVTEVHYAYFAHEDDSEELVQHRIRQSSNLLGACGMVSMEDAAIFQRIHIGNQTPGFAEFQKGVTSLTEIPTDVKQNDETGNLPRWEHYRKVMGFKREGEQ